MDLANLILYGTLGVNIIWLFVLYPLIYFYWKNYNLSTKGNFTIMGFNLFITSIFLIASFIGMTWGIWIF